jgi:hypothetical protein
MIQGSEILKNIASGAGPHVFHVLYFGLPALVKKGEIKKIKDLKELADLFNPKDRPGANKSVKRGLELLEDPNEDVRIVGVSLIGRAALKLVDEEKAVELSLKIADNLKSEDNSLRMIAHDSIKGVIKAYKLNATTPQGKKLWNGVKKLMESGSPEALGILELLSEGYHIIPGTIMSSAALDLSFPVDQTLLSKALENQVIKKQLMDMKYH